MKKLIFLITLLPALFVFVPGSSSQTQIPAQRTSRSVNALPFDLELIAKFAEQRFIFEQLFPGQPFEWLEFPYDLPSGMILDSGAYVGSTPYGPYSLFVDYAFHVDVALVPDDIFPPELKSELIALGIEFSLVLGQIGTPVAQFDVIGMVLGEYNQSINRTKFVLFGLSNNSQPPAPASGCSTNPDDYAPPPHTFHECYAAGKCVDWACVQAAEDRYQDAMASACTGFYNAINIAKENWKSCIFPGFLAMISAVGGQAVSFVNKLDKIVKDLPDAPATYSVGTLGIGSCAHQIYCWIKYTQDYNNATAALAAAQEAAAETLSNEEDGCCKPCPQHDSKQYDPQNPHEQ